MVLRQTDCARGCLQKSLAAPVVLLGQGPMVLQLGLVVLGAGALQVQASTEGHQRQSHLAEHLAVLRLHLQLPAQRAAACIGPG